MHRLVSSLAVVLLGASLGQAWDGIEGPPERTEYARRLEAGFDQEESTYQPGLVLVGSHDFQRKTRRSLGLIARTPTGRALLSGLRATGRTVTIVGTDESNAYAVPSIPERSAYREGTPGAGSDVEVYYNPDHRPGRLPAATILGHELIHALHFAQGRALRGAASRGELAGEEIEELRTIGVPPYDGVLISENRLRRDFNALDRSSFLPPRTAHGDDGDPIPLPEVNPTRPRGEVGATGALGRFDEVGQ